MKNSKIKKYIDCFLNLDLILGMVCLAVLVVITFLGAMMRYFFNNPFIWLEEVQIWMIIWAIFSGAGYAFRSGAHVAIDVFVDALPRKIQTIIDWFGFLCTIAMLTYVGFYGFKLNMQFLEMGKITSILKIPSYKIYWIVPVGCIWMMISYAYYMAEKYFLHTSPGELEKEGTN